MVEIISANRPGPGSPLSIEALMVVMTLCLMVYGLSEYELHHSLKEKKAVIPSQTKKPTSKPSLRWVYFLFRVVAVLSVKTEDPTKEVVINLNATLKKILQHFGARANAIYLNSV